MAKFGCLLFSLFLIISPLLKAQDKTIDSLKSVVTNAKSDTNKVNTLILISKKLSNTAFDESFVYSAKALQLSDSLGFIKGEALAYKWMGMSYFYQGDKDVETLYNWLQSLKLFRTINDKQGIANILSNIGALYNRSGDDVKSIEYSLQSLTIAEEQGAQFQIATVLQNIGNIYLRNLNKLHLSVQYFMRALPMSEKFQDTPAIITIYANLGDVYLKLAKKESSLSYIDSSLYFLKKGLKASQNVEIINTVYVLNNIGKTYTYKEKFDSAIYYQKLSVELATKLRAQQDVGKSALGLAGTYLKNGNLGMALKGFLQAEPLLLEAHSFEEIIETYAGLKDSYVRKGDFGKAFAYLTLETNYKDTLYNTENSKKVSNLQLNYNISEKEKDIKVNELTIQKQKTTNWAFGVGFVLVLIIAFVIYRNYRSKVKVNIILDGQKAQIENLMLNILPAEVAAELQDHGTATPRHYESASVLFTDFKSFTTLADTMSPQQLLEELGDSFMAFDDIVEKNQIEKIKTIGDSYMCAGGIPSPNGGYILNIIKTGIEMQAFVKEKNDRRAAAGLPLWELRIGVHVGPVVAGVVGKKKYAYDIWGNTVNIASRMESNGEPGKVNVSASTYELIKDVYHCSYRGKISAKNIGEIDMYFVDGIKV